MWEALHFNIFCVAKLLQPVKKRQIVSFSLLYLFLNTSTKIKAIENNAHNIIQPATGNYLNSVLLATTEHILKLEKCPAVQIRISSLVQTSSINRFGDNKWFTWFLQS